MTIETIQADDISKMEDAELHALRLQFSQVHDKFWIEKSWPGISKEEFMKKYAHLDAVMASREMRKSTAPIDVSLCGIKMQRLASGESPDLMDEPAHPAREGSRDFHKMIIQKAEDDAPERIVFGIVAEPNEEDTEGDWESAEDIQKALYNFMEGGAIFKMNHAGGAVDAKLLEAFIAPVDYMIEGESVKKGSWVQALRVDADTFGKIEDGTLTGFSMAGTAIRIENTEA